MLAADGTELKWLELVSVLFKTSDNNHTYKKYYLRPGSLIDSSLAPLENGQEGVVRPEEGYTLAGWVGYGQSELWDFAKDTVPDGTMTLLAVWGPEAPKVTLTADKTSVHVKGSFTLTAKAEHPLQKLVTYQYEWYRDGQKIAGEVKDTLVTDAPGSYTVQVKAVKGKLTSTSAASSAVVCTVTQHEYAAEWKSDGTNHWHACSVCGEKTDMAAHSFKWITDKEASSSEAGSRHEECSVCGYKKAAVEIPATGGGSSHSHSHGFGTEWKADAENHWHECRCGAKTDIAAHTFGKWKITKAPTAVRVGSRERTCTVCGYKAVETITLSGTASPQTGDASDIGLFMSLLLLSSAGLAGTVIYRRKKYGK